jgi:hypothetical protein
MMKQGQPSLAEGVSSTSGRCILPTIRQATENAHAVPGAELSIIVHQRTRKRGRTRPTVG